MIRSALVRARSDRGTSLLEVVVTAALLSGGVLATVSVLDGVRDATAAVDRRAHALGLATSSMEALRATSYAEVGISPAMVGYVPTFEGRDTVRLPASTIDPSETVTVAGVDYVVHRYVTWDAVTLSSGTTLDATWKRLTVVVDFDGGSRSVRLDGGLSPMVAGPDCSTRSVDTAPTPLTGVVNSYLAGTGTSVAGATVLSVQEPYRTGGGPPIAPGDLLLIVQMTSTPGGSAGLHEYAVATSAVSSGRLSVSGRGLGAGLVNAYGTDGQFQVVRVPTFGSVTTGAGLTALPWDGWTGGILAFDATDGLTLGAPVSVSGAGAATSLATVTPAPDRLLVGGGSGGRGGGAIVVRTATVTGTSSLTADAAGGGQGGTVQVTTERDDLADVSVSATGSGARGGAISTNTAPAAAIVTGVPDGVVDSAFAGTTGVTMGVGCLPALDVSVATSTPSVPRANGVTVAYRVHVANRAGRGTAENVVVHDFLPTSFGLESTSLVLLWGGATRSSPLDGAVGSTTPTWSTFTVPGGGSVDVYFRATLPVGTPLARADNEATATYTAGGVAYTATFAGNSSTLDDVVIVG